MQCVWPAGIVHFSSVAPVVLSITSTTACLPAAGALFVSLNVIGYSIVLCALTFPFDRYVYIMQPLCAASLILSGYLLFLPWRKPVVSQPAATA